MSASVQLPATIRYVGKNNIGELIWDCEAVEKKRAQVERQLSGLDAALRAFANVYTGGKPARKRSKMSAKGRARIAAAQRRRWKKIRAEKRAA